MRFVCCFAVVVVAVGGCTPPPVQAFERFYAATAARDVPAFRAALCPEGRKLIASVPDDALAADMKMTRVVHKVELLSEDKAKGTAVLDVIDATEGRESVEVRFVDGAWCVEMPAAETTKQAAP